MSGMLNGGMGSMGGMGGINPEQLMQMLSMGGRDPSAKPMRGDGLMGPGGMQPGGMAGTAREGMAQDIMQQPPQIPGMDTISTDFANTQPGLPNLPDSFGGFGYGQFAPKEVQPQGLRQQLISHLMGQLMPGQSSPSMGGMGKSMGGMGAPGGMRGL